MSEETQGALVRVADPFRDLTEDTVTEVHGVAMTLQAAEEKGLIEITRDGDKIVRFKVLAGDGQGFVAKSGELPGYPGTIAKQN